MPPETDPLEALRDAATRKVWEVSEHTPSERLPNSDEFNELQAALDRVMRLSDQHHAKDDAR